MSTVQIPKQKILSVLLAVMMRMVFMILDLRLQLPSIKREYKDEHWISSFNQFFQL